MAPYVGSELREKLENPLIFRWDPPVSNLPVPVVYGYDVTILIDICKAIIQADDDGKLLDRQKGIAKQARIIPNGLPPVSLPGGRPPRR